MAHKGTAFADVYVPVYRGNPEDTGHSLFLFTLSMFG
jgi:hypothetical protein